MCFPRCQKQVYKFVDPLKAVRPHICIESDHLRSINAIPAEGTKNNPTVSHWLQHIVEVLLNR